MDAIKDFFSSMFGVAGGVILIAIYITGSVGGLYWLWMAIQFGSFAMFAVLLFPPLWVAVAPVGFYSMIFGPPQWVINWFA